MPDGPDELAELERRRAELYAELARTKSRKNWATSLASARMRYHWFRGRGLFVGSGVVEARCKTVGGPRLKQAGMHWTVNGADDIIALRCRGQRTWGSRLPASLPTLRRAPPDQSRGEDDLDSPQIYAHPIAAIPHWFVCTCR